MADDTVDNKSGHLDNKGWYEYYNEDDQANLDPENNGDPADDEDISTYKE